MIGKIRMNGNMYLKENDRGVAHIILIHIEIYGIYL